MDQPKSGTDLFGEILMIVFKFIDSAYNTSASFFDPVTQRNVLAQDIFTNDNGRWFMRSESLPGNLSVRALCFDLKAIYLETGMWIPDNRDKVISDMGLTYSSDNAIGKISDAQGRL